MYTGTETRNGMKGLSRKGVTRHGGEYSQLLNWSQITKGLLHLAERLRLDPGKLQVSQSGQTSKFLGKLEVGVSSQAVLQNPNVGRWGLESQKKTLGPLNPNPDQRCESICSKWWEIFKQWCYHMPICSIILLAFRKWMGWNGSTHKAGRALMNLLQTCSWQVTEDKAFNKDKR